MTNVLVTGADGFTALNLIDRLFEDGESIVGIVRDSKPYITPFLKERNVTTVKGDITDFRIIERAVNDYDINTIYHLASQTIVRRAENNPIETYMTNVIGTLHVLETARKHDCFLYYSSTDKVYGECQAVTEDAPLVPKGVYSTSKAMSDIMVQQYARDFGLKVLVTRAVNIFGEWDTNPRIIPNTIRACLRGEDPVIFEGYDQIREYIYVGDLVKIILDLVGGGQTGIFNVSSGHASNQEDVVKEILKHFPERKPIREQAPEYSKIEICFQKFFIDKLLSALNPQFTTFEEGISKTVRWWKWWKAIVK